MKILKIQFDDPLFPELLGQIPDPPSQIYCWGNVDRLKDDSLAIVGTRLATSYGLAQAGHFAARLAEFGLCIVSGLAYGIDAAAHKAAMESGQTIAVIAQGLLKLQPRRHLALAKSIVEQGGLVLSEKAPDESALPYEYLKRNRIISGLSRAVLVVEAGRRSGAINTASHAAEQGRDVLVIPGRCTDPKSQGCNALIKKGAGLVMSPKDLMSELQLNIQTKPASYGPKELEIIKILGREAMTPAQIAEEFTGRLLDLYQSLHSLCQKNVLRCCPGQVYVLCSGADP